MNLLNAKKALLFNDFLSLLAREPLEIKYKNLARILHVSESTLSKLRHGKLNKMPSGMHPENIGSGFATGVVRSFAPTAGTVRRFAAFARIIGENYLLSDELAKAADSLAGTVPANEENVKRVCTSEIPKFIRRCYEESYANSEMDFASHVSSRCMVQSEIMYQKICDTINCDTFDSEKLKQLLNIVYAANIRHQLTAYVGNRSIIDLVDRFVRNQADEPFYNYVHRSEIISISEDSTRITRTIKGQQQIVFQQPKPQEIIMHQPLNHFIDTPDKECIQEMLRNTTCSVNHIPLIKYINIHENTNYTDMTHFFTARQVRDNVSGTVMTELAFRFKLYPGVAGETVHIAYECSLTTPFINNISCNYSFSLLYPCKFLEHEFALDAKSRNKWGVQVRLFTPMTTSACTVERPDEPVAQIGGTTDLKRITFYDWAMPGTGYARNVYELKYAGKEA